MTNIDKEIIKEDLIDIWECINQLIERHPDFGEDDIDIFTRFNRRMMDIERRLDA